MGHISSRNVNIKLCIHSSFSSEGDKMRSMKVIMLFIYFSITTILKTTRIYRPQLKIQENSNAIC
uniref:Uncharacterized protein n=1 Tax=Octopus bimaculoides TaxID=37653 RepID=A0A0L8ICQ6_OCTBM